MKTAEMIRFTVSWDAGAVLVEHDDAAAETLYPEIHDGSFTGDRERGMIDVTAETKRDALMLAAGWLHRGGIYLECGYQAPRGRPRKVDAANVRSLRAKGLSLRKIADKLGVTHGAVQAALKRAD